MEAISHRNQNITDPHAVGRAGLTVVGMVRIDGQRRLGKQQGRLLPLCKKRFGYVAKVCQASYDSNAKTTQNNPTAGHSRDTLHSPHRHSCGGRNLELRGASVRPEPVEACPEGTRRGPPARVIPRLRRNLTPCAGRHPDTTLLPPHRCLRYRLPMEVEISHRNQNITDPYAVGRAGLIVVGMVRIDGQRRLGKQQGRLLPLCTKLFGFVAKVCQASYDSNAKTTLNNHTAGHSRDTLHSPHRHSRAGRNSELRGASVRPEPVEACPEGTRRGPPARVIPCLRGNLAPCAGQHTDTAILPPHRCLCYRLPMEAAISLRNHNITGPHAVGRADLILVGMVRIDGQRRLGKQQGRLFPLREKTRLDSTRTEGWASIGRAHPRRLHEEWRRAVQWKVPHAPAWRPIPLNRRRHDPRDSPAASQRL